jgi:hypothetical protein
VVASARIPCLSALAVAALLAVALPSARAATVVVSPADVPAGASTTVRGSGFAPGRPVTVRLSGRAPARIAADRAGRFHLRLRLPAGTGPRALLSRSGHRRVLNVVRLGRGAITEVATSAGARVRADAGALTVGGSLKLRAHGLRRGATVRARFGAGPLVVLRAAASGTAAGPVPAPAHAGRPALTVRLPGGFARFSVRVAPAAASADAPPGPVPPVPAPPAGGAPRLVAVGDIACPPGAAVTATTCRHAATAALAASLAPSVVALLGDIQYDGGALADFQGSFAPTWGAALGPRLRPAPGNHEYVTPGASGYFTYFGARAGEPGRGWYSYDVGNWHVAALNTNSECAAIPCSAGSEQERWLRDDLAAHPGGCALVYWHHPRFSSGSHGDTAAVDALWRAARAGGADIALAGHDHVYERFAPQDADGNAAVAGTREFVVGTGGKSLYPVGAARPNSEVRIADTFGVLELELRDDDSYGWRFVAESGAVRDQGSGDCD